MQADIKATAETEARFEAELAKRKVGTSQQPPNADWKLTVQFSVAGPAKFSPFEISKARPRRRRE